MVISNSIYFFVVAIVMAFFAFYVFLYIDTVFFSHSNSYYNNFHKTQKTIPLVYVQTDSISDVYIPQDYDQILQFGRCIDVFEPTSQKIQRCW